MSLFTAIAGSIKPASSAVEDAVIYGAGTDAASGRYTLRGTENGKPYYNLEGQADDPGSFAVRWNGERWEVVSENHENIWYISNDDVAYPWLATWEAFDGAGSVFVASSLVFAPSSMTVTGLGAGEYSWRGFQASRPWYQLTSQPTNVNVGKALLNDGGNWCLWEDGNSVNSSPDDSPLPQFPNLATWVGSVVTKTGDGVGDGLSVSGAITYTNVNGDYDLYGTYLSILSFRSIDHPDYWIFWDDEGWGFQFNNSGSFNPVGGQRYFGSFEGGDVKQLPWLYPQPQEYFPLGTLDPAETITVTAA